MVMVFAAILKLSKRRRGRWKFSKYRLTRQCDATLNENVSYVCRMSFGLSAHISSTHFSLLSGLKSHPSCSTNTSGLTLFCTWLTARCLEYFPVCSRINCSSGNDDSSKKPTKKNNNKERTEQNRIEARQKTGRENRKVIDRNMFLFLMFFFFFLLLLYFCLGQSSKNDENINKMLRPFATCMMISSSICFSLIFVYISCDLWMRLDLNAALRDCSRECLIYKGEHGIESVLKISNEILNISKILCLTVLLYLFNPLKISTLYASIFSMHNTILFAAGSFSPSWNCMPHSNRL